uniref:Fascin-like domain-containing protein n=1 Tax=Eutreptiella gymnastica TaxID=73025 RepID=A0A7S1ILE2_9EUGL|mmetsp:Transcript_27402/g.49343  ORF Transcript_27402/g.49343 Transcript_27402/m.49343 type:complete len:561 (+) Transcript_27402:77-1759(+)
MRRYIGYIVVLALILLAGQHRLSRLGPWHENTASHWNHTHRYGIGVHHRHRNAIWGHKGWQQLPGNSLSQPAAGGNNKTPWAAVPGPRPPTPYNSSVAAPDSKISTTPTRLLSPGPSAHIAESPAAAVPVTPLTQLNQLVTGIFITIQASDGRYLAAVNHNTGQGSASQRQKVWRVQLGHGGVQLQCHSHAFLSADLEGRLSIDRMAARRYETFHVQFRGTTASLMSHHKKYVAVNAASSRQLDATATAPTSNFTFRRVPNCESEEACWGSVQSPLHTISKQLIPVVLFSSPKNIDKMLTHQMQQNQLLVFDIWSRLPTKTTIVFTDDPKTAQAAKNNHLTIEPKFFIHPKFNQPTYKTLFDRAIEIGDTDVVIYTNGDILYTHDLLETVTFVANFVKKTSEPPYKFMVVGQRINYELTQPGFTWDPDWEAQIRAFARQGQLFQANAQDYFAVSRALWREIFVPPFVVGGTSFDNWLTGRLIEAGHTVVDGTGTVTAVHLNHGHLKGSHKEPKSEFNTELALKYGGWGGGSVTGCQWYTMWDPATGRMTLWDRSGSLLWA